jgi:cation diffusion facilitator CzcD-associated flavoprotein CzcO
MTVVTTIDVYDMSNSEYRAVLDRYACRGPPGARHPTAYRPREVKRLLSLRASHVADIDEDGNRWTTRADPGGNEFDIIAGNGSD